MQKKTVLLDFDGTIIDSIPWIVAALNKLAPSYGKKPISNEEFEALRSFTVTQLLRKFDLPFYQIPLMAIQARREVFRDIDKMDLCRGMKEALFTLKDKGYRLGIVSSSPKKNIEFVLKKFGLTMIEFVNSELNIFGKAAELNKACAQYSIDKETAVYVGDEIRDVEASKKAGIDIVSVTWGFNNYEGLTLHGAKYLATTADELLDTIYDFGL